MTQSDEGFQVRDRRTRESEPSPEADAGQKPREAQGQATPDRGPRERSLAGLFIMLATFAVTALEGAPDPKTGQLHRDPAQAAELIDILMLLREKTDGRRTVEESQLLEQVIYDLQLRYVQSTSRQA